jgi:sterol 24-C-methyltransferase
LAAELATLFYEWGWGQSFHFAEQRKGETFIQSIKRHEWYLAGRLGVNKGAKILDVGCGIGGPMRNIAEFTGADVTGITINEYQVMRGNELNRQRGLAEQARLVQGDFMKMPFKDNTFDGVYAIEATCHAPRRQGVYGEIFRVLKPGCVFATYEWCLTDLYDPSNPEHRDIKKKIEEGDGLPDMATPSEVVAALKEVGFELIEARDCVSGTHANIALALQTCNNSNLVAGFVVATTRLWRSTLLASAGTST